ncbi:MAG: VIT1/CCC1 transporter family protein [Candidatus Bathyarchaeia archaeon]
MNALTDEERRRLLNAAKKIHEHKLLQIEGYQRLAERARDERIKQLLIRISSDEDEYAEFWSSKVQELGGRREGGIRTYLRDRKVSLMMSILGTKGLFEWAIVGEEEGIQDLAVQAEKIRDTATSETWSRLASDERMHLERMKTDVLGMEGWEIRGGGGVRDLIFGANDGLVSTLAFVAGVFGAITDPHLVLLSGVAELIAGTISVAAGGYQSSKTELEVLQRESERQKRKKAETPEEERETLITFYQRAGFKRAEAEAIVDRITVKEELSTQAGALEELGLAPKELGDPVKTGLLCGVSFGLAALVPILPFAFPISSWKALTVSIVATVATLFGVGAIKTIFSRKNWVRSGLEMMIIGASAAAITYMIGTLFSILV